MSAELKRNYHVGDKVRLKVWLVGCICGRPECQPVAYHAYMCGEDEGYGQGGVMIGTLRPDTELVTRSGFAIWAASMRSVVEAFLRLAKGPAIEPAKEPEPEPDVIPFVANGRADVH